MISIIVPVYKVEQYLPRCIDSILNQTYQDWELLLIDDGSPDNSGRICDAYSKKDARIKVFHKPNGGVSSARNLGLDNARGEWIAFVDADDYINSKYLNAIENADADIIITNHQIHQLNGVISVTDEVEFEESKEKVAYHNILVKYLTYGQFKTPWGKIIRRTVIRTMRFTEGQKIGEDTIFALEIFAQTYRMKYCKESTYYWQEGKLDYSKKYNIGINDAILFLNRIFDSYQKLEICSSDFEVLMLSYFWMLVTPKSPAIAHQWFNNKNILLYTNKNVSLLPLDYINWKNNPYNRHLKSVIMSKIFKLNCRLDKKYHNTMSKIKSFIKKFITPPHTPNNF